MPNHLIPECDFSGSRTIELATQLSAIQVNAICNLIASGPRLIRHYHDLNHIDFSHIEGKNGQCFSGAEYRGALEIMKGLRLVNVSLAAKQAGQDVYEVRAEAQEFYSRFR